MSVPRISYRFPKRECVLKGPTCEGAVGSTSRRFPNSHSKCYGCERIVCGSCSRRIVTKIGKFRFCFQCEAKGEHK